MFDQELFRRDPRSYALELVDQEFCGRDSALHLLEACLQYMSHDDVRDMLDSNELSPRFDEQWDGQPDEQQEWADFDPDC